jgi:DMSO reductase anchor subunit
MLTVFATSMIYRSLKPIRQWHNRWVSPTYLALALASGALCLNALLRLFGAAPAWSAILALAATAAALAVKRGYWRFIDRQSGPAGAASATGLGGFGRVRLLEPPHTSENYLQKEMGFRVARRHADKLRRVAVGAGFVLPLALTLAAALLPGALGAAVALLAAKLAFAGLLVERWLFFAEAKHTVTLYYGAEAT